MLRIPDDPNAKLAFEATCKNVYEEVHGYGVGSWDKANGITRDWVQSEVKGSRLRAFVEEGEFKTKSENGVWKCEVGFRFQNIVDQCEHYRVYRCNGGHHYGVVFVEHKEREGSRGNERKIVVRNGEMVFEDSETRNEDQLELD